jgi:hypothetical protein
MAVATNLSNNGGLMLPPFKMVTGVPPTAGCGAGLLVGQPNPTAISYGGCVRAAI